MKRILTFGAAVLVVSGLGFLPMIGCVANSAEDAGEADVPLAPEAVREVGRCGTVGAPCCVQACCHDGSVCVYRHLRRTCMKNPPHGSIIIPNTCGD